MGSQIAFRPMRSASSALRTDWLLSDQSRSNVMGLQTDTKTLPTPKSCPFSYRFWIHMLLCYVIYLFIEIKEDVGMTCQFYAKSIGESIEFIYLKLWTFCIMQSLTFILTNTGMIANYAGARHGGICIYLCIKIIRFSKTLKVQNNLSRWTLWVLEAKYSADKWSALHWYMPAFWYWFGVDHSKTVGGDSYGKWGGRIIMQRKIIRQ